MRTVLLGVVLAAAAALAVATVPVSAQDPAVPPQLNYDHDSDAYVHSLWSDGATMWVADRTKTLEAFTVATGARDSTKDITIVDDDVRGVRSYWTDGATMWVVPYLKEAGYGLIRAYNWGPGTAVTRVTGKDIDIESLSLEDKEAGSWYGALGVTSDGTTLWVAGGTGPCCRKSGRLYAYDLDTRLRKAESDIALAEARWFEFQSVFGPPVSLFHGHYPRGLFTDGVTMWVGQSMHLNGVKAYDISTKQRVPSHDLDTGGGTWGMWANDDHMWVSNFRHTWVRAFTMPASRDARLSALSVAADGADLDIGTFSAATLAYDAEARSATVTVSATAAHDEAVVTISPADAVAGTEGHQVSLVVGENVVTVTVQAADTSTSRSYSVTIERLMQVLQVVEDEVVEDEVVEDEVVEQRVVEDEVVEDEVVEDEVVEDEVVEDEVVEDEVVEDEVVEDEVVEDEVVDTGLTVGFVGEPASHEGSSLTFRLQFSEAITTSYVNVRDDVVTAVRATVSGARRVDGRSDLWEITLVPDSNADVEVSVSADAACGESEAVCNADDEQLANSLALSVPGPPLTASFADAPASHDGASAFSLRVQFSEAITTSYVNVRDDVFTVTNGDVTRASRVDGRSDLWEITVDPASDADIDITLSADAECGTDEAVCTSDAKQLSNNPTVTVDGTD